MTDNNTLGTLSNVFLELHGALNRNHISMSSGGRSRLVQLVLIAVLIIIWALVLTGDPIQW